MVVDTAVPGGVRNPASSSPTPEQYRKEGFFRDKPPGSGTTSHSYFQTLYSNSRKRMMAAEEQTHSHSVTLSQPSLSFLRTERRNDVTFVIY